MNVLLLAHRVPFPPNKGEKIRTYHQLSQLIKHGHNVVVVTPLEQAEDLQHADALKAKLNVEVVHSTLSMRFLRLARGLLTGKPLTVTNFHNAKLQREVDRLISETDCDVLMCTSSGMADYVLNQYTLKKIQQRGIRLVMDFMDLDSLKWKQYAEQKPWPLSSIYKREAALLSTTESEILDTFDASVFVSADEKSLLDTNPLLKNKVHVVTNGVDAEAYYPDIKNQTRPSATSPTLLFTGVMDYFPNEDAVIWFTENVWPLIIIKYPSAKFIIAGMRPSKKVSDLTNNKGVEVTGFVDDILPYYQNSDLMVAPFQVARGIQNKVLQAMASGLPVITSPAGAAGISCTDGEHLVVADTAAEYLTAIDELLNNRQRYRDIQMAGLELVVKDYSWENENTKLEIILIGEDTSNIKPNLAKGFEPLPTA